MFQNLLRQLLKLLAQPRWLDTLKKVERQEIFVPQVNLGPVSVSTLMDYRVSRSRYRSFAIPLPDGFFIRGYEIDMREPGAPIEMACIPQHLQYGPVFLPVQRIKRVGW